ncbi:riboflavin transporter FmnP [Faecalicoccus acidiformans]|uniref:Riboflavin transporter n=1 Tax=Faecalicoccus acidiformans TaxID=915173 RepID=A0A7W8D109_9FIRM|nr:ECF transporter S component [Faecalicoccus acidiformans]MBB5184754.1 riboflavin transporter FmnP [Faecalicoccus acidiformans]
MSTESIVQSKTSRVQWIAKVSILSAVAFLLMLFEIPLPFFPPFYKLGFDEVAVMIGGFAMGPLAGAVIETLKIVLNLLFQGTDTACVGEISNLLIGLSLVIPSSIYYQRHKTRKGALVSLVIGTLSLAVIGSLSNYFIALPAYSYFYGLPMDAIVGMGTALFPLVSNTFTFVLFMTLPFNILKGVIVGIIVFVLYKRISPLLHR